MTWKELVHKGKDLVDAYLVWIILGGLVLAVGYVALSKLIMRRRTQSPRT